MGSYRPLEWVVVRAPLLSVDEYVSPSREAEGAELDPRVRAALAVGGGELLAALDRRRTGGRPDGKAEGKLQRYLIRMSTRPTPYGLFAGVALARWGRATDLALADDEVITRTRPDMAWLMGFIAELEERRDIRERLRFRANTAVRETAGRLLLPDGAEDLAGPQGADGSLRATGAVRAVLAAARTLRTWDSLVAEALDRPGATRVKAETLLTELCHRSLLVSELRPPLTGADPAQHVAERLRSIARGDQVTTSFAALLEELGSWDAAPIAEKGRRYPILLDKALGLHASSATDILQVDSAMPLAADQISAEVGEEAARAAELLMTIGPGARGFSLAAYRQSFVVRYGVDREVPLLELLDPATGLGPPHATAWTPPANRARSARREALLFKIASEALRDRHAEVNLDDHTLGALDLRDDPPPELPASIDLAVLVLGESRAAIDAGAFRLLVSPNVGSQAAGRYLGRFADLLGPEAERALIGAAHAEDRREPNEIVAELVYMPSHARSANVTIRPAVRAHEIVVGATPGVPEDHVVPLDELVVGMSGERLYIRWPRHSVRVRVRAGHMLNSRRAPTALRFLEDVERDGVAQLSPFDWGPAGGLSYLPRVTSGRVILQPARWRVDAATRARELPSGEFHEFAASLTRWRVDWMVPARIYLTTGDNRLLVDLEDDHQVEQLRGDVQGLDGNAALFLEEPLPDPATAWLPGPQGRSIAELVVPLVLRADRDTKRDRDGRVDEGKVMTASVVERLRPPGSEWLYLKLYVRRTYEDELIGGPMQAFANVAVSAGLAAEWFFVRYADPDAHIRLRFRGAPDAMLTQLAPRIAAWAAELLGADRLARFAFDTYERELERYGGQDGTTVAESVFAVDSVAVARLLEGMTRAAISMDPILVAALSIDHLLADLGLNEAERLAWYRRTIPARHEGGSEYRAHGRTLRGLLAGLGGQVDPEDGGHELIASVLDVRRAALAPLEQKLRMLEASGLLSRPRDALWDSYVHLHCNRLLSATAVSEREVIGLLRRTREGLVRAPHLGRPTAQAETSGYAVDRARTDAQLCTSDDSSLP